MAQMDWQKTSSPYFIIHYPKGQERVAAYALVFAEQARLRYEKILSHKLNRKIPVFIYPSHQDFAATNILPYEIGEGTGGFTDYFKSRVTLPFTGDYANLRHVLSHEIAHAFQFDILNGENPGVYPLWLMEGMAEYLSLGWDSSAERYCRDLAVYGRLPSLYDLQSGRVEGYGYYKVGQLVMGFISSRWGEERIGFLFKELRNSKSFDKAFQSSFEMGFFEFDVEFGKFVRNKYRNAFLIGKGDDLRLRQSTDRYKESGFSLHPVLSPNGKQYAYMTSDSIFPAIAIRNIPGPGVSEDKKSEKRVVVRALRSEKYEEYQALTTRLIYSPDGKKIYVAGRYEGRQSILAIDVDSEKIEEVYSPPLDAIQYPSMSSDGKSIVFVGVASGQADIFSFDLKKRQLHRLTDDLYYEMDPVIDTKTQSMYFVSNKGGAGVDSPQFHLFKMDLKSYVTDQVTILPGVVRQPMPGLKDHVYFTSDWNGIRNVYRLDAKNAHITRLSEIQTITQSRTGVVDASLGMESMTINPTDKDRQELLIFTELQEGALEVKLLPSTNSDGSPSSTKQLTLGKQVPQEELTYDPSGYAFPTTTFYPSEGLETDFPGGRYHPGLALEGFPFLLIGASTDSTGNTNLVGFAYGSWADLGGDHRLQALASYLNSPPEGNLDIEYNYLKHRVDLFAGAYKRTGTYGIFSMIDFDINNLLYNPLFRLLDRSNYGAYGGLSYPLHKYGSVSVAMDVGREERTYSLPLPEERIQNDVFDNYLSVNTSYQFDNIVYSLFGPLDGHAVSLGYSVPLRPTGTERSYYALTGEFRYYHLFSDYSNFAFRLFGGSVSGDDAFDYPFRLGGFYTLRGYDFLEFEGTNAFLMNIEYRFNLIEFVQFGFPVRWSPGPIRGAFFFDAGAAFDDPRYFQGYSEKYGVTRDLKLSFGVGLHWPNFLWFLIPGAIMKVEWGTPYDTKRALPLSKWRGQFSVGFNY